MTASVRAYLDLLCDLHAGLIREALLESIVCGDAWSAGKFARMLAHLERNR